MKKKQFHDSDSNSWKSNGSLDFVRKLKSLIPTYLLTANRLISAPSAAAAVAQQVRGWKIRFLLS